ncbi:MAG: sugar ABC transporter ATP-binding protein [Aggregatilineales bacterium]
MEYLLQVEDISKAFPGVQALSKVSFNVVPGEVHALVGENGAGKSTLMKILAGVYQPDEGRLLWQGQPLHLNNPFDAQALGISIIFQEFNLLADLTVAENVLLNREPRSRFGLVDWRALNARTRELLALLEADLDPTALVEELTVAQQQIVEIVKALAFEAKLIIMDEPTAALNPVEVHHLFNVIQQLTKHGSAVIFISHRLDEVMEISNRVTVLKDGRLVATTPTAELKREDIVRQMVGRELEDVFPPRTPLAERRPLLTVRGLSTPTLHEIDLEVGEGEIVGVAGLEGHGQRELARALFGLEPIHKGEVRVNGRALRLNRPRSAIEAGLAFISDDRKAEGLALRLNVRENITIPNMKRFSAAGFMRERYERQNVIEMVQRLNVRISSPEQQVRLLSGGNQQKTVLAKWLVERPRMLVFAEPTRGIDIGAKVEIYHWIHRLAGEGTAVLMVSSELLELLGLCHRVIVMRDGRIAAELPGEGLTEEAIMFAATGTDYHSALA